MIGRLAVAANTMGSLYDEWSDTNSTGPLCGRGGGDGDVTWYRTRQMRRFRRSNRRYVVPRDGPCIRKNRTDLFSVCEPEDDVRPSEIRGISLIVCYEDYSKILQSQDFLTQFRNCCWDGWSYEWSTPNIRNFSYKKNKRFMRTAGFWERVRWETQSFGSVPMKNGR